MASTILATGEDLMALRKKIFIMILIWSRDRHIITQSLMTEPGRDTDQCTIKFPVKYGRLIG